MISSQLSRNFVSVTASWSMGYLIAYIRTACCTRFSQYQLIMNPILLLTYIIILLISITQSQCLHLTKNYFAQYPKRGPGQLCGSQQRWRFGICTDELRCSDCNR